ncbi:MAG: hypothetical protein JST68_04205 [Bacteroidetes bacterium]|nr:hypothetical protein [Bacteroidota bacterium]
MKFRLLFFALLLSFRGWCASSIPPQHPVSPAASNSMIVWALIAYLLIIVGWAVAAKSSLDKILKGVLQDMEHYQL